MHFLSVTLELNFEKCFCCLLFRKKKYYKLVYNDVMRAIKYRNHKPRTNNSGLNARIFSSN